MEKFLQFELVSPEKLLVSEKVEMVVVPGSEGDLGILPEHSPLISNVRPGVIKIYEKDAITKNIFVAGGFCEISIDSCTVLATEAIPVDDINKDLALKRRKKAHELKIDSIEGSGKRILREIQIAEAMLEAIPS